MRPCLAKLGIGLSNMQDEMCVLLRLKANYSLSKLKSIQDFKFKLFFFMVE